MLDEGDKKSGLYYVKKSFEITRSAKSIFRFLCLLIILSLAILPFNAIGSVFESNIEKLKDYANYKDGKSKKSAYYHEQLSIDFGNYSREELRKEYNKNLYFSFVFSLFYFIFIYSLFDMLLTSFYKRELKQKT